VTPDSLPSARKNAASSEGGSRFQIGVPVDRIVAARAGERAQPADLGPPVAGDEIRRDAVQPRPGVVA